MYNYESVCIDQTNFSQRNLIIFSSGNVCKIDDKILIWQGNHVFTT